MKTIKDEIISLLDKQNEKGMEKYGQSLDECPLNAYDWNIMIQEELIDALQYALKENKRLQAYKEAAAAIANLSMVHHNDLTGLVLADVDDERSRQEEKWGVQRHDLGIWLSILGEEYGEVCEAVQTYLGLVSSKPSDAHDLYTELIQLAAVAVAMAEQVREESTQ